MAETFKGEIIKAVVECRRFGWRSEVTIKDTENKRIVWFASNAKAFFSGSKEWTSRWWYGKPMVEVDRGDELTITAEVKMTKPGREEGWTFVVVSRPKLVERKRPNPPEVEEAAA